MTYRVFICDDEPEMLQRLLASVKGIWKDSEVRVFSDGSDLQDALQKADGCDILLLDIDMPGLTGLDIARNLSGMEKRPLLAFVTSHDELVYDSLQFHPFGFVRKSHMDTELEKLLKDCVKELFGKERHFCFQAAGARVKLQLCDILYFEAEGNYLKIYTRRGSEEAGALKDTTHAFKGILQDSQGISRPPETAPYRFRETLSAVEAALSGSGFVRIHKGYLVNQAAVKVLRANEAILVNGACIPIGRSYAETVKKKLMRYMLG